LWSRRMFFHGVAVTVLAAASASQVACVVATRDPPRRARRQPRRYRVRRRGGPEGRVLLLPRDLMVGDELEFETGYVSVVRGVYPDRVDLARGHRTVSMEAEYE
jgi:hypothetical protein